MLKKRNHKFPTNHNSSLKLCKTSRLFHFDLLSCLGGQLKIQWFSIYFSFKNLVHLSYLSIFFFVNTTLLFFHLGKLFPCKFLWKIPHKAEMLLTLELMPTLCVGWEYHTCRGVMPGWSIFMRSEMLLPTFS